MVISEKLAKRRGFTIGGEMQMMFGDRVATYIVRGLLKDEGPARVLDGNFVLMDIAAAQLAFDRLGRIDRLDVLLPDGADLARLARRPSPRACRRGSPPSGRRAAASRWRPCWRRSTPT